MPKVTFLPEKHSVEIPAGSTILAAAKLGAIEIRTDCEFGYCGTDPMRVLEGVENLSAPVDDELENITFNKFPAGVRMACSARVHGDVVVERFNL